MCACNKSEPRRSRPTSQTIIRASSQAIVNSTPSVIPQPVQSMDQERLRIEKLRREAQRKSFGR